MRKGGGSALAQERAHRGPSWVGAASRVTGGGRTVIFMRGAAAALPLVYHPHYSAAGWPPKHRFPMWKFTDLYRFLSGIGLATGSNVHRPIEEPPSEWFERVHDSAYYRSFMAGDLGVAAERRIGFGDETRRRPLIRRTVLECAGTVRTVQLALDHGLAAHLAGGTHHAHRSFGSGFTILNDLAVAAAWAIENTAVRKVAVVDLDVHQGDGTAAIFDASGSDGAPPHRHANAVFTFSMHCGQNFPFRKARSDLDVDLPKGTGDAAYLSALRETLPRILSTHQPDLVLYDAGVDVYAGDQLGYLALSHAGIYQRDLYVIDECCRRRIPVACVIGGGYDRDPLALARRHGLVHRAAARVWARRRLATRGP